MIPKPVASIRKGDVIQFAEKGAKYTVAGNQIHSFEHTLRFLSFDAGGPGTVTVPQDATVYAVEMYREVTVPCLPRCRKEGIAVLWNLADGPPPIRVICKECDEETTREVLARMEKEKRDGSA